MTAAVYDIADPALYRASLFTVLFGGSGTGKTRLSLTYPDPLVIDMDGTIGRFAKINSARITTAKDDLEVNAIADAIARGEITCGTLIIDGYTRLADHLDNDLGNLNTNVYWRQKKERIENNVRKLMALPCHVVITTRAKDAKAKPGDVVGGYVVGVGENVALGELPDLPAGIAECADLIINLTNTEVGWEGLTIKSLVAEFPQHEAFADPVAEIAERIERTALRLAAEAPANTARVQLVPSPAPASAAAPAAGILNTVSIDGVDIVVPTNAELNALIRERNSLVGDERKIPNTSEFLKSNFQWNGELPIPTEMRLAAQSQILDEIEAIKRHAESDQTAQPLQAVPQKAPAESVTATNLPAAPNTQDAVAMVATPTATSTMSESAETAESLLAYATSMIAPSEKPASGSASATKPPSDAELMTLLRQRNTLCSPKIMDIPLYMRRICGLEHVRSYAEITPPDRHTMAMRMSLEIATEKTTPVPKQQKA